MVDQITRRLAAILVADMVGFSTQMELDEKGTLERLLGCHRELINPGVIKHHGKIIKTTGDGVLVEFVSVVEAINFAVEFQKNTAELKQSSGMPPIQYRIGINVGDVMAEGDDIFGDGVNVAARLEPLAEPGGVVVSSVVVDQARDLSMAQFENLGYRRLKNIAREIEIYRVVTGVENTKAKIKNPPIIRNRPSIAVLPFKCMSSGLDDENLADGLTEDIITGLSRFKELFVISRTSAFAYKNRSINMQEVAMDLGVRFILEGSVRRAGERVRVTAQLIDAPGGDHHIWANRYDRQINDIFEMQDELTSQIVATLPGRIEAAAQERAEREKPENMAAYELVLAGKLFHHRSTREANVQALNYLDRAIELAPDYAHAWAWRACTLSQAVEYGWLDEENEVVFQRALDYLIRAQELDDEDSDVHRLFSAVGMANNDFEIARRHQERAMQLNPNDDLIVVQQGELLTWTGEPEQGVMWIKKAMALNPYHPERFWGHLGRAHFTAFQNDEAIACFKKLSTVDHSAHAWLAAAMAASGEQDGARRHGVEVLRLAPNFTINKYLSSMHYLYPEDLDYHRSALLAADLPV